MVIACAAWLVLSVVFINIEKVEPESNLNFELASRTSHVPRSHRDLSRSGNNKQLFAILSSIPTPLGLVLLFCGRHLFYNIHNSWCDVTLI